MRRLLIVALACLACAAVGARTGTVRTTTTCDAASPYDNLPDDAALQACLDAYDAVLLQPDRGPGYVGYLVAAADQAFRGWAKGHAFELYGEALACADPADTALIKRLRQRQGLAWQAHLHVPDARALKKPEPEPS